MEQDKIHYEILKCINRLEKKDAKNFLNLFRKTKKNKYRFKKPKRKFLRLIQNLFIKS